MGSNIRMEFLFLKWQQLSRAPIVAWEAHFGASRRGKKVLNYSRDKNARHVPYWGGGRRTYCVTPDLSYDCILE